MKKIVSLALVLVLALSFVACGKIGDKGTPDSSSDSVVSTPVEVNEETLEETLFNSPDFAPETDEVWYWQWKYDPKLLGLPKYSVESIKGGDYYDTYFTQYDFVARQVPAEDNFGKMTRTEYKTNLLDKLGLGELYDIESKEYKIIDEKYRNINNSWDYENHFGFLYTSTEELSAWFKANPTKSFDDWTRSPFSKETALESYAAESKKVVDMAENYITAKYTNEPLTTPTSDWFNKHNVSFDKVKQYLADNSITTDNFDVVFNHTYVNLLGNYPYVAIDYRIVPKSEPNKSIQMFDVFAFEIVKNSDTDFTYAIEAIANYSEKNDFSEGGFHRFDWGENTKDWHVES